MDRGEDTTAVEDMTVAEARAYIKRDWKDLAAKNQLGEAFAWYFNIRAKRRGESVGGLNE